MPGLGHKSYLQMGVETTYGTAVAAAAKIEIISANADPNVGTIPDPSLFSARSRRALYQGGLFYEGAIKVRGNYGGGATGGLGRLIKAALGAVATTGAGPFTHTYKEETGAAQPPSLTLELGEGDIPTTKVKRVIGTTITGMTVAGTAGQGEDAMLQFTFPFVAKTITTNFTPTAALAFPTISPMLFHQSGAVTDDGSGDTQANQRVRSFELTLVNNYALDRFYFGSLTPDQPLRNDFLSARWRFTSEFADILAVARAGAFTTTTPKVKVVSGADSFELRSNSAKIVEYGNPVEGYGIILMNMVHEAFYDPTDLSALVGILINGNTGTQENGNP